MTRALLLENFEKLADAPDGIPKLRALILQLAVRGKLVPQDPEDEPAYELLKRISAEKEHLIAVGEVAKPRSSKSAETIEEPPFAAPVGWEWSTLEEVSSYIQRGKGPKYVEKSDIPVVSQKCVQWSGFTMDPVRYVDPDSLAKYGSERLLRTGDLLWNSTGTGTIGRVNVYDHGGHSYEKVVADSHVTVVRPLLMDSRFVWTYLASPDVQNGFEDRASGSTNQIELSTTVVRNQRVPVAPLEEQKRIVAKVDELMALCDDLEAKQQAKRTKQIALNRASLHVLTESNSTNLTASWHRVRDHFDDLYNIPETVVELRQSILQLAVMGRLVPQDPDDEPASELLKKIQAEKQQLIAEGKIRKPKPMPPIEPGESWFAAPNGWEWIRAEQLLLSISDGDHQPPPRADSGVSFLVIGNVSSGKLDFSDTRFVPRDYFDKLDPIRTPKQGDVLYTVTGSFGLTLVVDTEQEFCVQRHIAILKVPEGVASDFVAIWLKSPLALSQASAKATGIAQKTVSLGTLRSLVLPLPPIAEQKRIVAKVDQLITLCDDLEAKLQQTQTDADHLLTAIVHSLVEPEGVGAT